MGYYTRHDLSVMVEGHRGQLISSSDEEAIITELRKTNENAEFALEEDGSCADSCKWYSHADELREFSKKYPKAIFVLSGEGEESGDIWKEYYQNGKMQRCQAKIVFDNFNKKLLK